MKKKFLKWGTILVGMSMAFALVLSGCGETPDNSDEKDPTTQGPGNNNNNGNQEEKLKVTYRSDYTPTKFSDVTNEVTQIAPGVHLVANKMTLQADWQKGNTCVVYTVEVDLNKADIVAGTKGNQTTGFDWAHATPYRMALDWEQATGGKVYASMNADFFAHGDGGLSVNAFVKDGVILKAAHNDNSNYDYKQDASDVPASAPMLFGVKGTSAQIAPITTVEGDPVAPSVKEQIIKSKLFYALMDNLNNVFNVQENAVPATMSGDKAIAFHTSTQSVRQPAGGCIVKVDTTGGIKNLKVLEDGRKVTKSENVAGGEGYAYLQTKSDTTAGKYLQSLKAGDTLSFSVASDDGKWNGYETILGCRQALVINNQIPGTVTKENTNGAQNQDIPRTAVGIKNGKVVLFGVESLYYYASKFNYTPNKETDFHGMNLPELAEFAYYYGCSDAANFDGGGSTQLITKPVDGEAEVIIRAAEYFTRGLHETRAVVNAFLITSKVGK